MGAVEGDFRIDFHKDLLKAEMSVDRKIRELRQRDHLGGRFDNMDFKTASAIKWERRDRREGC